MTYDDAMNKEKVEEKDSKSGFYAKLSMRRDSEGDYQAEPSKKIKFQK